jgi:hypothetical protein
MAGSLAGRPANGGPSHGGLRRIGRAALHCFDSLLELFEAGAGSFEDAHLGIELVAGDQVELREACAQHGAKVVLQVLLDGADRGGHALEETSGYLVNSQGIHVIVLTFGRPELSHGHFDQR